LKIEPIDITRSDWNCTIEDESWELGVGGWGLGDGGWVAEERTAYSSTNPQPPAPNPRPAMRLGMRYVKGLREESARAIVRERMKWPFADIDDLANRVTELRKDEMKKLAEVGALNFISGQWSEVGDRKSEVRSQRSEIRRQEAEGRRQRS